MVGTGQGDEAGIGQGVDEGVGGPRRVAVAQHHQDGQGHRAEDVRREGPAPPAEAGGEGGGVVARTGGEAGERTGEGRVAVRYVGGNPNGSLNDIAGVTSENGRIVGLMPHPEHAVEDLTGPSTDGLGFFTSVLQQVVAA